MQYFIWRLGLPFVLQSKEYCVFKYIEILFSCWLNPLTRYLNMNYKSRLVCWNGKNWRGEFMLCTLESIVNRAFWSFCFKSSSNNTTSIYSKRKLNNENELLMNWNNRTRNFVHCYFTYWTVLAYTRTYEYTVQYRYSTTLLVRVHYIQYIILHIQTVLY